MAKLIQDILTLVAILTISVGRISAVDDDNFISTAPDEDRFPSLNFVPAKLRLSDAVYDRLMVHLGDQLLAEDVEIPIDDYFPKEVESDEEDELQFVQEYNLDEDENETNEFIGSLPNDAKISSDFGKREFKFGKVLEIRRNGTKTFSKFRQSAKIGGRADTSATGNYC